MGIKRAGIKTIGLAWASLILMLCLFPIKTYPVAALGLSDFSVSYNFSFSKTEIKEDEIFNATVNAKATCVNELLVAPTAARITGRVVAQHNITGTRVTLNPSYTVNITNFPSKKGQSIEVSQTVSLQFPKGSQTGSYTVSAVLIVAEVNLLRWWDVTSLLPSTKTAGSVNYTLNAPTPTPTPTAPGNDGGGTGGGGSAATTSPKPQPTAGTVNLTGLINDAGILTQTVNIGSIDGKCQLTLENGTRGTIQGVIDKPVATISVTEMKQPPSLPDKTNRIGLAYDLQPDGSVFNPPLTLVFSYSDLQIPDGVDEKNLVLAYWDKVKGKWVELEGTVDPEANTITAKVSHFCTFAAVAHTQPATFTASQLSVVPAETHTGEKLNVSITLANEGDISGSYEVTLKIDDYLVAGSQTVTLAGHSKKEITFSTSINTPGTHTLNIAGVSGTVAVNAPANFSITDLLISPPDVNINDKVNIGVLVTNNGEVTDSYQVNLKVDGQDAGNQKVTLDKGARQQVSFTVTKEAAGKHVVDINGLTGSFSVTAQALIPETETPKFNLWWLALAIAAVLIIIGLVFWQKSKHRQP